MRLFWLFDLVAMGNRGRTKDVLPAAKRGPVRRTAGRVPRGCWSRREPGDLESVAAIVACGGGATNDVRRWSHPGRRPIVETDIAAVRCRRVRGALATLPVEPRQALGTSGDLGLSHSEIGERTHSARHPQDEIRSGLTRRRQATHTEKEGYE